MRDDSAPECRYGVLSGRTAACKWLSCNVVKIGTKFASEQVHATDVILLEA